jgi:predicted GH43/DUF377 family glycosyl hydrolase
MKLYNHASLIRRHPGNPILTGCDFPQSYRIAHVFNSGVTMFKGKYLMMCRCEDAGLRAYFWMAESDDGIAFKPRPAPIKMPTENPVFQRYASINFYDPRITEIDGVFYIMHACHSQYDCRISLLKTTDFETFDWIGYVSDPGNRNGVLFPQKFNGKYVRLDRPLTTWESGDMWISYSHDLIHWGESECILRKNQLRWAWSKIGAGAVPIKTKEGWLNLFHGVRTQCKSHCVYQIGACLHDLEDPSKIIALAERPLLMPTTDYELNGQTPSVAFSNGAIVEKDGTVKIYYGGADTVQCLGFSTIQELLDACHNRI